MADNLVFSLWNLLSGGPGLNKFHNVGDLLGRRGRHTPVVACESLTIPHSEVSTSGCLKDTVHPLGPLWNRTNAGLAERMTTRWAVVAVTGDSCVADMAKPPADIDFAVRTVQLVQILERITSGDG